jgi:hypothetical protein
MLRWFNNLLEGSRTARVAFLLFVVFAPLVLSLVLGVRIPSWDL